MKNDVITDALSKGLNPGTLNSAVQGWEKPTGREVRLVLGLIGDPNRPGHPMTGAQAAKYLGLADGRAIRNWQSQDAQASSIPYSAWVLLCYKAGLGLIADK